MNQTGSISTLPEWIKETINGGSFRYVDLQTGNNGWATPPGNGFSLRSVDYFTNKQKSPGGDYLLSPAGVDWLKSTTKLEHVMSRPDNRITHALKKAQSRGESLNTFIFTVNFQLPGKELYSLVHYYATEEPIPSGSLLDRYITGDDSFRNQRLKLMNRVVQGPRVVKAVAGNYDAILLSKAMSCSYYKGSNYFEIDVDLSSSAIMKAALRFVMGYVTRFTMDVGLLVEAQEEDELPERLIGAVRICQMELSSAFVVDDVEKTLEPGRLMGSVKVNQEEGTKVSSDADLDLDLSQN